MISCIRASRFTGWFAVTAFLASTPTVAQHPVAPPPHPPAAPMHVYAPPVYHAPVVSTPIMRPPVYAPITTPLRATPISSRGPLRSGIVLPPVRPIRPIRPIPPLIIIYTPPLLFAQPFWGFNGCWDLNCNWFWPWTIEYTNISSPGPTNYVSQASETPIYVYGDEREDRPQLYLKDGTILNVSDYWVVDNQLHFKVEETGVRPVEQVVPFEELDLQKTIDVNTQRGFRFLLRNEPFERYLRDHPDGPPAAAVPPQ